MLLRRLAAVALLLPSSLLLAAPPSEAKLRTAEQILKTVTVPEGYEASVFAMPPQLGYPTSVSAAPDGTLFVAVDENGSLDRKEGKGKVVRIRDTDGDGVADEFKTFAEMDSPRGVIWDGASGTGKGALYVMHPPNLTAYYDDDGDGVSDRQEDLVTGLGFGLDFRGADHTTNGCRLAIDGFIYIAVGDYGYVEAKGKDGTVIKNRGGGIVRVRPDGTGLEIVSRGQRNIYDVAVSPTLDLFTRDNTNDGGGWNVRLSYVPPGAHMGYPYYFKNFPEDRLDTMMDYGGGSPCGSLWLDEPGLPKGLFTVEWGASAIMQHTLKPEGAGWAVDGANKGQTPWIKLVRPTDMDVDASGRLYLTSWEGATFNYNGPAAGYVLRVVKKGWQPRPVPNLATTSLEEMGPIVADFGASATMRQAIQREFLKREINGDMIDSIGEGLLQEKRPEWLVWATSTLSQIPSPEAAAVLNTAVDRLVRDDSPLAEYIITALGDLRPKYRNVNTEALVKALSSQHPRVRAAAIVALRRLGQQDGCDQHPAARRQPGCRSLPPRSTCPHRAESLRGLPGRTRFGGRKGQARRPACALWHVRAEGRGGASDPPARSQGRAAAWSAECPLPPGQPGCTLHRSQSLVGHTARHQWPCLPAGSLERERQDRGGTEDGARQLFRG